MAVGRPSRHGLTPGSIVGHPTRVNAGTVSGVQQGRRGETQGLSVRRGSKRGEVQVNRDALAVELAAMGAEGDVVLRLSHRAGRSLLANLAAALNDPKWAGSGFMIPADALKVRKG